MNKFIPIIAGEPNSINSEIIAKAWKDKRNIINIIPKMEINKINNYIVFIDKPFRLNELFNTFFSCFYRLLLSANIEG